MAKEKKDKKDKKDKKKEKSQESPSSGTAIKSREQREIERINTPNIIVHTNGAPSSSSASSSSPAVNDTTTTTTTKTTKKTSSKETTPSKSKKDKGKAKLTKMMVDDDEDDDLDLDDGTTFRPPSNFTRVKQLKNDVLEGVLSDEDEQDGNQHQIVLLRVPDYISMEKLNGLRIDLDATDSQEMKLSNSEVYELKAVASTLGMESLTRELAGKVDMSLDTQELNCALPNFNRNSYKIMAPRGSTSKFTKVLTLTPKLTVPDASVWNATGLEVKNSPTLMPVAPKNMELKFEPFGFHTGGYNYLLFRWFILIDETIYTN